MNFIKKLKIQYINYGKNFLLAKMPITPCLYQPMGILHGGATISLAETVGSMLSNKIIGNKFYALCIEISANHISIIKDGILFAKAILIHKGKKIHFVQIKVFDNCNKIISQCKMTNIIISKNEKN